jgi:hypothetical protein
VLSAGAAGQQQQVVHPARQRRQNGLVLQAWIYYKIRLIIE